MSSPLLDRLNPMQRTAVLCTDGPLLVLAGAGSGKTRVITHRIAYLIEKGVSPDAILAVTFTNKAAREMRERVWQLTSRGGLRVQTFHSFCASFLRLEFPSVGRATDFTIYDDGDGLSMMKLVVKDLGLDPELHKPDKLLGQVSRWKNDGVDPEEAMTRARRSVDEHAAQAYEHYDRRLREANACDFDDLLLEARRILRDCAEVRTRWQTRLSHVLVDEFQDTNGIQYGLVRELTRSHRNLCVTGDQDQSIYSWRGARVENFDTFLTDHAEAKTVKLEQNYRSTGNILRAAVAVIEHNQHRIPKRLWTEAALGTPVRIVGFDDDVSEAISIAGRIRELEREGIAREEIAVLFRTNSLSLPIERALLEVGVPYVVVGGLEFFARQEVKDLLAYLRFLANPHDLVSLFRIINVPARGLGNTTRDELVAIARRDGRPLGEVLRDPAASESLPKRARTAAVAFAKILNDLDQAVGLGVAELLRRILDVTGYDTYWQGKATKGGSLDPHQNIGQFVNVAVDWDTKKGGPLSEFLAEIALLTDQDRTADEGRAVSLMTLHAAKGLEFDAVFLLGVDRTILPHVMSYAEGRGDEEERRLLHVGITRAKKELVITYARARTRFGSTVLTGPSNFLDEVGRDGIERYGEATTYRPSPSRRRSEPGDEQDEPWRDDEEGLSELDSGSRVWHPEWGRGEILQVRGRGFGLDRKVTVRFDQGFERTLILRHANLVPLEE